MTGIRSSTIGSVSKRQGFHSSRTLPGSSAARRCPSAETQIVLGDLKNRCSWRMAEGFSKKNSVRDADVSGHDPEQLDRNEKRTLSPGLGSVNGRGLQRMITSALFRKRGNHHIRIWVERAADCTLGDQGKNSCRGLRSRSVLDPLRVIP